MKGEIDRDFYCVANEVSNNGRVDYCGLRGGEIELERCKRCKHCHRKHPTPEQYKEEYGEEWNGAVYIKCGISNCTENCNNEWILYPSESDAIADMCATGLEEADPIIVCACTPFGMPDADWRPLSKS